MKITEEQRKNMLHALGLGWKDVSYRNYYCCSKDHEGWDDLVSKGFAIKRDNTMLHEGDCYFHVTKEGADFLGVRLPKD